MKKLLLSLCFLFPFSASAFVDIQNSEFKPYIDHMVTEKLVSGYSDGAFKPNNTVSFVESLKIITNTSENFEKIVQNAENWSTPYKAFYQSNFLQNEKTFSDNEKITRDFAIYYILKNAGIHLEGTSLPNSFPDVHVNSVFAPYINFAKIAGISNGYADGNFWPHNTVTRGELAKMTWKALRENKEQILQRYHTLDTTTIQPNTNTPTTATVFSITDGDTIKIKNTQWGIETIRILGIDAPELTTSRFGYAECYGAEAKNYLAKILPIGASISIVYHDEDKYQRDLAEVSYNDTNIAESIVKNGYSWVYRGGIEPSNYQQILEAETLAKNTALGLWATNTCAGQRKPVQEKSTEPVSVPYTWECYIKGNINKKWEKIYHMPDGKYYKKTVPEACFNSRQEAESAGFRASKV